MLGNQVAEAQTPTHVTSKDIRGGSPTAAKIRIVRKTQEAGLSEAGDSIRGPVREMEAGIGGATRGSQETTRGRTEKRESSCGRRRGIESGRRMATES